GIRRAGAPLLPGRRLRGGLRRRGGEDRSALRHQRPELRPLQNLRHQGSVPEHRLDHARGRRRPELSEYVTRSRRGALPPPHNPGRLRPMRLTYFRLLLSGCAVLALAAPAAAQDAPIIIDPPLREAVPPASGDGPPPRMPEVVPEEEPADEEPATPPIPEVWSPAPFTADGRSAYGLYLSGRAATHRGEPAAGAELLALSQSLTPEQPRLGGEAFLASLFSGDVDAVVRLAPFVAEVPVFAGAGRLARVVQTLRDGDGAAALTLMRDQPLGDPYVPVSTYLMPAVAAAGGDWETALQAVEVPTSDTAGLVLRD